MNTLIHVSINLFPLVMLLVIYLNNHKKTARTQSKRQFNTLTLLTILLMCMDVGRYAVAETGCTKDEPGLWVFQILYTELIVLVAGMWLIYVCVRLYGEECEKKVRWVKRIALGVPGLYFLLALTTPWTHAIFYYAEGKRLVPGMWYHLPHNLNTMLLLGSIALAGHACFYENSREQRRECLYLMCFGFVPFVGMELQHHQDSWWIGAPCVALSLLIIYINTQNQQITTDGLTGLNNRMDFDLHLKKRAEQLAEDEWGMLMMDVDEFKVINDNFGHAVGDEALWETADILRRTFGSNKAFLARYGGDEFVVIADWEDAAAVKADIMRIEREVAAFNERKEKPYRLSLSIGYAMWSEVQREPAALMEKADARMYQRKTEKKAEQRSSRS